MQGKQTRPRCRIPLILLLCASFVGAGERAIVEFRLKKHPTTPMRGWATDPGEAGFRFERFGGGRLSILWKDLVEEDRLGLRRRFKLEVTEDERRGIVVGHRLRFKGGGSIEGLLVRIDDGGRHWIKRDGMMLPYPRDRVAAVENDVRLEETDVFDKEELYWRRIKRTPPRTAAQHRAFAERLAEVGDFESARKHFEEALRLEPMLRHELGARLADVELLARDAEAVVLFKRIRSAARLRKDYDGAKAALVKWMDANPERRRAGLRLLDEIEQREARDIERAFHVVKAEEFSQMIDDYVRRAGDLSEAMSWATAKLPDLLRKRLAERLGISEERVRELLETKPRGAPHWSSYKNGTFAISKRAKRGKSTKRKIRGDPESWWASHQSQMRGSFLRAYAAERLPDLFEIVQVRLTDCPSCGGTGQTKHVSVRPLANGSHEWRQTCRRCYGARTERAVGYK